MTGNNRPELTIYSDGASRNNPGEAGAGVYILRRRQTATRIARYLGRTTNNIAEYTAAIIGLEYAVRPAPRRYGSLPIQSFSSSS